MIKGLLAALVFVGLCLVLSSCTAQISNTMSSWEGQSIADLLASWGPPQQVYDDGQGGRIMIWTDERAWTTPGQEVTSATGLGNIVWGEALSATAYVPPQRQGYTTYRMFFINKERIIYRWSWKGL